MCVRTKLLLKDSIMKSIQNLLAGNLLVACFAFLIALTLSQNASLLFLCFLISKNCLN